ncbi:hypothetical protein RKD55_003464 [Rossellomorea marisflavi]
MRFIFFSILDCIQHQQHSHNVHHPAQSRIGMLRKLQPQFLPMAFQPLTPQTLADDDSAGSIRNMVCV